MNVNSNANVTNQINNSNRVSEPTPVSPVYSLDSVENHTAASLLNHAAGCSTGPAVLDGWGWTSALRPE